MEIADPIEWREFVESAPANAARWIAHPISSGSGGNRPTLTASSSELWCAIGPEGGFTDEEVAAALNAGWQSIDLGCRTLRVETAAIALAAWAALTSAEERT